MHAASVHHQPAHDLVILQAAKEVFVDCRKLRHDDLRHAAMWLVKGWATNVETRDCRLQRRWVWGLS